MNKVHFCRVLLGLSLAVWSLVLSPSASAQYTNGIYAEFNTSMGSYTCRLEYALAPKAVANFIGLATGQRAWLDLPSGVVKTNPFYSGTTFHRVMPGFMNQGGSPNGLGTDGPGYAFVDEFTPSLRFDGFGVLAMANSGKDSNGSQYFVTVAPTPWLNDVHTIFGRLYGGSNVVYAINNVATDVNSKPLTNVFVNAINIRRVGPEAAAFDVNTNGLPLVTNLTLSIARSGTNISLSFSNRLYADTRIYATGYLTNWGWLGLGIDLTGVPTNSFTRGYTNNSQFFRAAQIQYPASTLSPKTVSGRTLALTFTNGTTGTLTITFNSSGGGNYTFPPGAPGTVTSYTWSQLPYNGQLWPIYFSGLVTMTLALNFDTALAGSFTGKAYTATPFTIGGSFTLN